MESDRSGCFKCVSVCCCCQALVIITYICCTCLAVFYVSYEEEPLLVNITDIFLSAFREDLEPNTILLHQVFTLVPALGVLVVYSCLPELRNLQGKILMCYIASCAAAHIIELLAYLCSNNYEHVFSFIAVYARLPAALAQFTWVTLMCYDISATFSRPLQGPLQPVTQRRQFLHYSLFGWGFPMLSVLLRTELQLIVILMSVLAESILCTMLFVSTLVDLCRHTLSVKSSNLRRHGTAAPDWILVSLRLTFLMILESVLLFVDVIYGSGLLEILFDWCLTLQGTILFVLLVCKKRVFNLLLTKFQRPEISVDTTSV